MKGELEYSWLAKMPTKRLVMSLVFGVLNVGTLELPLKSPDDQENLSLLFTKPRRGEGETRISLRL